VREASVMPELHARTFKDTAVAGEAEVMATITHHFLDGGEPTEGEEITGRTSEAARA
jgi:hypothetical protein